MQRRDVLKAAVATTGLASAAGRTAEARGAAQATAAGNADTIHVHPARGADGSAGTKEQPLRSLAEAVKRVNHSTGDSVVDSFFAANRRLAGSGTGARLEYADIDPSFLQLVGTTVTEQAVTTERDQTKRHYLHPVSGTAAAKVGAGLFTTPAV